MLWPSDVEWKPRRQKTWAATKLSWVGHKVTANLKVRNSVYIGPPPRTVDTTIFEMWLGSLSTHRGLSIPAL